MKIKLNGIFVDNQDNALKFYTETLGFVKKRDVIAGNYRWLTVISPDWNDTELVLEPNENPAAKAYQKSIYEQKIPITAFETDDIKNEYEMLKKHGVVFQSEPMDYWHSIVAIFDDTCWNFIQIQQIRAK